MGCSHRFGVGSAGASRTARRAGALVGAVALFAVGAQQGALAEGSSLFRGGSALTGSYKDKLTMPMALHWKHTTDFRPFNSSSPIVADGTAFFSGGNRIYAVDVESGSLKWRYPQDQPMDTLALFTLAHSDGTIYFGAGGMLNAVDAKTGKLAWQFNTLKNIVTPPNIVDDNIFFGTGDGRIWCISKTLHTEVTTWRGGFRLADEPSGSPAVANGMVYALGLDQTLYAIGLTTGKERSRVGVGATTMRQTPAVDGEYVYVAAGSKLYCYFGRNLAAGAKWTYFSPDDIIVAPTVADGVVYVVSRDGVIRGVDGRTGKLVKWKTFPKLDYGIVAPPAVSGDSLIACTAQGMIYVFDTATGGLKWQYLVQASTTREDNLAYVNIGAAPVVSDGALYVLADDGSLNVFRSDAVDTTAPTVVDYEPEQGLVQKGAPPIKFLAKITDAGSGLKLDSIKLMIDNDVIPRRPPGRENQDKPGFTFDVSTGVLDYDTPTPNTAELVRPLADGRHTITVVATDWAGNTAMHKWVLNIDNSLVKLKRKIRNPNDGFGPGGSGGSGGPGGAGGPGGRGGG